MTLSPISSRGEIAPIPIADLAGYPSDATKALLGNGTWAVAGGQTQLVVGWSSQNANAVWPVANSAILVPFTIFTSQTIASIIVAAGGSQSGNFDIGVYTSAGVLKVSKGSTAQSTLTASVPNSVAIGSTVLPAGSYYLAQVCDNTVGSVNFGGTLAVALRAQRQVAASFPLPANITVGAVRPQQPLQLMAELT